MARNFKITCRSRDPEDRHSVPEIVISSRDLCTETAELVVLWHEHNRMLTALADAMEVMRDARRLAEIHDENLMDTLRAEWLWQSDRTASLVDQVRDKVVEALSGAGGAMRESRLAVYAIGTVPGTRVAEGELMFDWPEEPPPAETETAAEAT